MFMDKLQSSLKNLTWVRWTTLGLVSFSMLCSYYLTDALAPLEQRLESNLHWSASDYGLYSSGYGWFNVFLLMLILGGMILDKAGVRFTGILSIIIMLAGAGIKYMAISGYVGEDMWTFGIGTWLISAKKSALVAGLGFAVFGVGAEMFGITANKAVIRWFKGKELALAIGLNTSVGRIGTALAMFTPIPLVNLTKHLTTPVILSIFLLCIGLISFIFFCMFDKKLDKESKNKTESPEEEFKFNDLKEIVKVRAFWYITILCVLFYSAVFPFIKYATNLIVQKFGVSEEFAGIIPALLPFGALILTPFFGNLYDKKGKGATIMIAGSVILLCVHLLFAIPSLNSLYIAIGLVLVLGVAFSLVPSSMWPSVAKIIPEKRVGTAYAMTFWVQNWGIMGVPMLIGFVLDKYCVIGYSEKIVDGVDSQITLYDYTLPMLIFACFGALAVFFSWLLKREDKIKNYGLENPNQTS